MPCHHMAAVAVNGPDTDRNHRRLRTFATLLLNSIFITRTLLRAKNITIVMASLRAEQRRVCSQEHCLASY